MTGLVIDVKTEQSFFAKLTGQERLLLKATDLTDAEKHQNLAQRKKRTKNQSIFSQSVRFSQDNLDQLDPNKGWGIGMSGVGS